MNKDFEIDGRRIGVDNPPYVIAEMSANHLGDLGRAKELIVVAGECGADAVKLQHFTADTITTGSSLPEFKISGGTVWDGRYLHDLYSEAAMPWEWTEVLMATAADVGIAIFSSPFDPTAVKFLDDLAVPAFKVASFELTDIPLIERIASTGRPLIMSTGMATLSEIDTAVRSAVAAGAVDIALLRCNSGYPAPIDQMDLRAIPVMANLWPCPIGLSDHSLGSTVAIASVALGACIIEKHFTLSRSDGGADAAFSAEPAELAELVRSSRDAWSALGTARFGPAPSERSSTAFRRSLRSTRPIKRGEVISDENVRSMRPGGAIAPHQISLILGARAIVELPHGKAIEWSDLEWNRD